MTHKLYKYAGPDVLLKQFAESGLCQFKCSLPSEFNDPYELFMTVDYDQNPDTLAYYQELIGEIPRHSTTCFSKSPAVVPMWAHYSHNHRGVTIEIDEQKMTEQFPNIRIEDVDYRTGADPELTGMLQHAVMTRKPRHAVFFIRAAYAAAYFTKHDSWQYEQERRVVDTEGVSVNKGDFTLLSCADDCVTGLIVGSRASRETQEAIRNLSKKIGCQYYDMKIARSSAIPYFRSPDGENRLFENGEISTSTKRCSGCDEPARSGAERCVWCAITEEHKTQAAGSNMLRAAADAGLLDDYLKVFDR